MREHLYAKNTERCLGKVLPHALSDLILGSEESWKEIFAM